MTSVQWIQTCICHSLCSHQILVASQDPQDIVDLSEDNRSSSSNSAPPATTTTTSTSNNLVTSDITMQAIHQQMAMVQQLAMVQQPTCNPENPVNAQIRKHKWNQMKYCWPHGACNHWSPDCRTKAEGHQDSTTFQDRKEGSPKNLQ